MSITNNNNNPLIEEPPVEAVEEIDVVAKEWIQEQSDKEVKRIRDVGSSVLPLKIKNCGIISNFDNKKPKAINRVEVDTNCDLSKVQQIMVSPSIPYPHKDNFNYVNLILVTNQPIPFLVPYLYKTNLKVIQPAREIGDRKFPSKEVILKNDLKDYLLINKNGIRSRFTIHEYHDALLQRQYKKSYFYSNQQNTQAHPKKLAIFDFDSTLFFSPLLSPTIWHPDLIKLATAESVYGPGWWRDIRSLDLGPIEELEPKAWKGFWNEPIVKEAKRCINDPNTMTVVLTGRRYHPFHLLIPTMLNSKGLQFDLIGLRPDPEQVSDNHWEVKNGQQQLTYNLTSSVFKSTMHFKTCFILNLIHNVPSVRQVTMWDDRTYHVNRFKQYLNTLRYEGLINKGRVVYVPGVRPKYNPSWEKRVIGHIMETHNKALLEHRQEGIKIGKIEQRMKWSDEADVIEEEDPLGHSSSERPLRLTPLPAATVIKLSKETTHYLQDKWRETVWNVCGGEEPEYFGDCVYLSQHVLSNNQIKVARLGSEVKMKIIAYSDSNDLACLLLKVQVEGYDEEDFLLPLWYKPSEYNELFKTTYYSWRRVKDDDKSISIINGKVDYAYRLGAVEKTISQKRPCQSHDDKKRLKKE
ncbi:uncharacterized protein BX663DRAFT_529208 [Cokeromyces recurvatus]|uniref:uncharacterized protein n=1 Tax=Cokeromyces recurvatus TaxID=90255 RepID=UPI002220B1EF|nr:uncharacterized protein BX663DRAFT_529208 [Cokeromyces recurvatus]KAI7906474.1 hypothetical protein BX663DRAFT_529208 [Cokeromyces recurvatus]